MTSTFHDLLQTLPQLGRVDWIGLRPVHRAPVVLAGEVQAVAGRGLEGDRARSGVREVTLIQAEHLIALASLLHRQPVDPSLLRRNLVVSGINLLALKDRHFQIGTAIMAYTGQAHPCSRMEEALGAGALNAMRGHGGITARVIHSGTVRVGDAVGALHIPATADTGS